MPRLCSICQHAQRHEIERDLLAGIPNRRIAAQRAVSEQAVRRHKAAHVASQAAQPRRPGEQPHVAARKPSRAVARPFQDRRLAKEAGRKGGQTRAARLRAQRAARVGPAPFRGTILDMMDAAGLTGPSWAPWRVFWKAVFGLAMRPEEVVIFRRHTARETPPAAPVSEAWQPIGRRGGKSRNAALAALYLGIRVDHRTRLAPGETAVIPIIAADRKQARQVLGYLKAMLTLEPFAPYVSKLLKESVQLATGVTIEIFTASYRTGRGYTCVGLVCDEVAFWYNDDDGANPDSEILTALRPAMATVPDALLLGLSTPYARKGELYKAVEQYFGQDDPHVLVWNADTASMNPTIPAHVLARAFAEDPIAAASEYGEGGSVAFRRDVEAFLDPEAIKAVTIGDRRELPWVDGLKYSAFVDTSGGSADSFTLAIAHREDGRAILDLVRERRPPFSPDDVVKEYADTLHTYGMTFVTGDHYAAGWPRERFLAHGIGFEASERTKSDIYRELLPAINAARVELLDVPRLATQLVGLERRVSRGGRDSIDHVPGGHDDMANAAAGALVMAGEGRPSKARDPKEDEPFDAWSPEALQAEYERTHRVKRHFGRREPPPEFLG